MYLMKYKPLNDLTNREVAELIKESAVVRRFVNPLTHPLRKKNLAAIQSTNRKINEHVKNH